MREQYDGTDFLICVFTNILGHYIANVTKSHVIYMLLQKVYLRNTYTYNITQAQKKSSKKNAREYICMYADRWIGWRHGDWWLVID